MSTTTVATREQVDAAYGVAEHYAGQLVWDDENDQASFIDDLTDDICSHMIPVGMVIASAADVATVPTADELAAMRELVSNAPGFDEALNAIYVIRAYLERVTG